jgi:hypothetical protein
MSRWILALLLTAVLAPVGNALAQPRPRENTVPMTQVRGADNVGKPPMTSAPGTAPEGGTISSPAARELSARSYIVEWLVTATLTILAVFAVGRSSWRG